ncbi:hypothetical protein [Zhongshania aquimaris]|uniref:Uncharacterized protein n=1 Tax=Zhongshania aquimaris TaxID=2857107 RepID=A0ABS6VUX4_9GAMM|nr:hypothetical protein [Zhongshania aquimaris]MBW2942129.1 hypothetical protein [Zhongshania aquimaris]
MTILFSAISMSGNGFAGELSLGVVKKLHKPGLIGVVIDNILNSLFNRLMSL